MANILVVANELSPEGGCTGGAGAEQIKLRLGITALPLAGGMGESDTLDVTLSVTSTANQWKTAFLNAATAWATAHGHTISRLIGFVDIISIVP